MAGKRKSADATIAERLYCRVGKRVTTFFYKHPDNRSETLANAPTARPEKVQAAKIEALEAWGKLRGVPDAGGKDMTVKGLFGRYFAWQDGLPESSSLKKARSTLATNRNEQTPLLAFFGDMMPRAITQTLIYEYMDIRAEAGAPAGCVKEVALLSAVLRYGIRKGELETNPCHGVQVEARPPRTRRVTWEEVEFVTTVGRAAGGSFHVQALAARAAWLAFKRPGEVLKVPRAGRTDDGRPLGVTEAGLVFEANKRKRHQGRRLITIEWSPTLRATVDEALAIGRWQAFGGDRLIFGNMAGHRYSRSGWGTLWRRLMDKCAARAQELGQPFTPFTLMDCRPGGVTEKKRTGQDDVYEGTGHVDRRMVDSIYDRREDRSAKPAK
ncbi:MAG TPA: hypothetical protein VEA40_00605 [Ramlibacter sp.]|nr:hypothetical protein [Ramlibacter sp.]